MRDTETSHTFDIEASALARRRGVEPVNDPERWPDIEGPRVGPRPAKPFVGKGGRARTPSPDATSDGGEVDTSQVPDGEQTNSGERSTRQRKTPNTPADVPADTSKEQQ
ncbi:hypothetical protein AB0I89_23795 [Micromonospora sp. NPDC049801]|uniref:hypothetical protein n=1 Tax=unclassified Micromonospora TaxID=2617518 RepID=UPI003401ED1E